MSSDASSKRRTRRLMAKHPFDSGLIVYGNLLPSRIAPMPSDGYGVVGMKVDGNQNGFFVNRLDWRPQWVNVEAGTHLVEFFGKRGQRLVEMAIELPKADSVVAVSYDAPYKFRRRDPRWRTEVMR